MFQICNLSSYLKNIEGNKNKPKANRKKKIIKNINHEIENSNKN